MSHETDRKLWERSASGDSLAFSELFRRHGNAVYNHCFRRTANWTLAEDLASVVFLQAWKKRDDVRFVTDSILPWLLAVANNVCRNGLRSQHRYRRLLSRVAFPDDVEIASAVEERIDAERQMGEVLRRMQGLSDNDRDIIALCLWAELDHASVAKVLDIPTGTVKSRLARAKTRLQEAMEPYRQGVHGQNESHKAFRPKEAQ